MNPTPWAWAAIWADAALLGSGAVHSQELAVFAQVVLAHALIAGVAALACLALLPRRLQTPRWPVLALLFCFSFMAPVVGAVGLLVLARFTLRRHAAAQRVAKPQAVALPVFDVQFRDQQRGGQGAIRSRLASQVPAALRMQSLLTLQAVPDRVSNPILEDLLGDDTDDVRLVAFGMLDTAEKKIASQIREQAQRLTQPLADAQRFDCLRQLAELHWEMVYAGLAQGELRQHMLTQAAQHADAALAMGGANGSGLIFLRARIWLEHGELDAAQQAFEQALALGQPRTSAWPYLAEIAFRRRDIAAVRDIMTQLARFNLGSRTRAVEAFWVGPTLGRPVDEYPHLNHL